MICCEASKKELHGFCDSPGIPYSAAVFVRSFCEHGMKVQIWLAKALNGKILIVEIGIGIGIVNNIGQMLIKYIMVCTGKTYLQQVK